MNKAKDILKILFSDTKSKDIDELIILINTYGKSFGLDTNLRLGHFLAQVREEIGTEFKPRYENLNYKPATLIAMWSKRFDLDKSGALDDEELAAIYKYGRTSSHPANQEMIANIVYYDRLGNGNLASGDGWRYRGTGSLQITGKYNFQEVQKRIDKYAPNCGINIVKEIGTNTLKGTLIMGMAYWIWKDLYKYADMGKTDAAVNKITSIINLATKSYTNRRTHFNKIKHLL